MTSYRRFRLLLSTLRYLTCGQIWHRARRIARRRWWSIIGKQAPRPTNHKLAHFHSLYAGLLDTPSPGPWEAEVLAAQTRAKKTANMEFCFLKHGVAFGQEPRWNDATQSQLWRYHLHYFDYLRDLFIWKAGGESRHAYQTFRQLVRSWIDGNATLSGDGWHAYTISLRVVNWIHACSVFEEELHADRETKNLLLSSLYAQSQILFTDLEFDVRGNHLLENLRALIWAGLVFEGVEARQWFARAMRILEQEVEEQILTDGGHFERSPGYHLVVFKDLLEIGLWLRRNDKAAPAWLDSALHRMHQYLWSILAPDGNVPLLKDTAWDAASNPRDLLTVSALYFDEPAHKYSEQFGLYPLLIFGLEGWSKFRSWTPNDSTRDSVALPASRHYVMRDEQRRDYLILDAGKTCPDYLPAHAHADLLTYELSSDGQRVVVDSGVYEYRAGPWRDFFRSTRAHNTIEVAGENQSEVWSSFRVGRRAHPGPVHWRDNDSYVLVQAEHDGYLRLSIPVVHQRTILWRKCRFWAVIDQLWGDGSPSLTNYVHLSPGLSLKSVDLSTWAIPEVRLPLWLTAFGSLSCSVVEGQTEPVQGWYSEEFGEVQANTVLALHSQETLPQCCGYIIARGQPAAASATNLPKGHEVKLTHEGESRTLRLVRGAPPEFV